MKRTKSILAALATLMVLLGSASGLLAQSQTLGLPEIPHGFPAYFQDSDNLKLELCLENADMCFFDPVNATTSNDFAKSIGWDGEAFWFLAEAVTTMAAGGDAELTLGIEATWGGGEEVFDGNQISFGRLRIRFDTEQQGAGTYRVTHPYGVIVLNDVPVDDKGPNYTADIGATNILDPASAFNATLLSDVMNPGGNGTLPLNPTSFLTWPDYQNNATLLLEKLDANGTGTGIFQQYIGDPRVPHIVTGSRFGTNYFKIEKLNGDGVTWTQVAYTDLFNVYGRVFDGRTINAKTEYGVPPQKMLAGHGPINRVTPFAAGSNATVTGAIVPGYPVGYPLWYEDMSGLKLTITFPPMGISEAPNATVPEEVALGTGGETFYWSALALMRDYQPGLDASVEFALEGTFGGTEALVDGNQIVFGRTRIRIDTPVTGTYTVVHPYGNNTFEVTNATEGIGYTADIGASNPLDPDNAFFGALYGSIGPNLLTWDTFNPNPSLNDPALVRNVNGTIFNYVGDPATTHTVTGGTFTNSVQIFAPNGTVIAETDLFTVTGQVFEDRSFGFLPSIYLLLNE